MTEFKKGDRVVFAKDDYDYYENVEMPKGTLATYADDDPMARWPRVALDSGERVLARRGRIAHAPADLAALVAVVREVEALHQPEPRPSFTEASYEMSGTVPGSVRVSNFRARDVTTCKGCHVEWPCPTAAAVQKLGEAADGR